MHRPWVAITILFLLISAITAQAQEASGVVAEAFRVVNIRSGPSTADAVIGQLSPGEIVQVVARNSEDSDWLLIQSDGVTGWVAYFVVSVVGDPSNLPIQADAEQIIREQISPDVSEVGLSELSLTTSPTAMATTFRRANIRTQPDIESPVLIVVQRGEALEIVGRSNAENDWLQVETENGVGWIAYFLVAVDGELGQLPIIAHESMGSPGAEVETVTAITRYNANLRTSPSLTSAIIQVVPFNAQVVASARNDRGDWIRVTYEGDQGWILAGLVSSDEELDQLALAE
jgi:uncharacterized protein YgiM (DUF1202 family)